MPDIIITTSRGTTSNPTIQFSGSASSSIRLEVLPEGQVAFMGNSGSLFGIVDVLTGSLSSVNDISGLPIFEVFSDDRVVMGRFNSNAFVVTGSSTGIGKVPNTNFVLDITGSVAITGSIGITGTLTGTASYSNVSQTASYVVTAQTASYVVTAQTASYVVTAQTASYVVTAQTASFVATASWSNNATSASYASTSSVSNFNNLINKPTLISASAQLLNSGGQAFSNTSNATFGQITASMVSASYITASNLYAASVVMSVSTMSVDLLTVSVLMNGTASWANQALTASYVINSQTASYVTTAQTASYVVTAQTASYVLTASYSLTSSHVLASYVSSSIVSGSNVWGGLVGDSYGNVRSVPQNIQTSSYTLTSADIGRHVYTTASVTIPPSVFSVGDVSMIINSGSGSVSVITGSGVSLYLAGTTSVGNRTISTYGMASITCVASNLFYITGTGVT